MKLTPWYLAALAPIAIAGCAVFAGGACEAVGAAGGVSRWFPM